ncbi:MAG: hypothetical protein FWH14_05190 [Oscillospiraceae bacterium]|nr:hypothetical protein [Oscillospiraceae bacterium]
MALPLGELSAATPTERAGRDELRSSVVIAEKSRGSPLDTPPSVMLY